MKVNVFRLLMSLVAICAFFNFELVSAASVPLSDVKKPLEVVTTPSALNVTEVIATTKTVTGATKSSIATLDSSENASVESSSGTDTLPPLVFPSDEEKILPKNETALKILQKLSSQTVNATEESKANETLTLTTLPTSQLNVTTVAPSASSDSTTNSSINSTTVKEVNEEDYDNISSESEKNDSEIIQDNDEKETEDELEEEFAKKGSEKATINMFEDPVTSGQSLHSGHIALIFASILVVFSVLAYVGLVLWRSRLESRYGMRQRLVTEDDYYNNNDVRYFGL